MHVVPPSKLSGSLVLIMPRVIYRSLLAAGPSEMRSPLLVHATDHAVIARWQSWPKRSQSFSSDEALLGICRHGGARAQDCAREEEGWMAKAKASKASGGNNHFGMSVQGQRPKSQLAARSVGAGRVWHPHRTKVSDGHLAPDVHLTPHLPLSGQGKMTCYCALTTRGREDAARYYRDGEWLAVVPAIWLRNKINCLMKRLWNYYSHVTVMNW
jgi:hypothetical protein